MGRLNARVGKTYEAGKKPIVAPCEKPELCDPVDSSFGPFKVCYLCGKSE